MKKKTDIVFVVLTYKNYSDLSGFLISLNKIRNATYNVVVVNSFFDVHTSNQLLNIAQQNNCDFIEVQNHGYGSGNNAGIKYALDTYQFDFLVISNPDIEISTFDYNLIDNMDCDIIAPKIITLKNKNQNPYYARKHKFMEWIYYIAYKYNLSPVRFLPILVHKIDRYLFNYLTKKNARKIFACHGSFFVLRYSSLIKTGTLFNEEMFLFAEENHLSRLFEEYGLKILYAPIISVLHKEDGSVGGDRNFIKANTKKSFILYYDFWKKK